MVVVRDAGLRARLKELYLRSWQPLYRMRLGQGPDEATRRRLDD